MGGSSCKVRSTGLYLEGGVARGSNSEDTEVVEKGKKLGPIPIPACVSKKENKH